MNNLNIIVINLHNRPNRLIHTIKNLRKCELSKYIIIKEACTIVRAKKDCDKYISLEALDNINNELKNTLIMPTWGSVACAISHMECYKYIFNNKLKFAVICEDDLEITDKKKFKISFNQGLSIVHKYYNDVKNTSKNILLTFNSKKVNLYNENKVNNNYLEKISGPFKSLQFYIINYNMAKNLYYNLKPFVYQLDIQIGFLIKRVYNQYGGHNIISYNFKNCGIIHSKKFKSDVQYHFITLEDLQCTYLNNDIIYKILSFLPNKNNLNNNIQPNSLINTISDDWIY